MLGPHPPGVSGSQMSSNAIEQVSRCLIVISVASVGGNLRRSAIARSTRTLIGFNWTVPGRRVAADLERPLEARDFVGLRRAADAARVFLADFFFDTRCSSQMRNVA